MEKSIEYYMNLPYTIELQRDPEAGWFARVKELRGCMSQGETPEEALAMIQEAMELWLEVVLEDRLPIPEPRPEEGYSGKFVIRVPRSLHRELVEEADHQGVSLNQYINVVLAHAVGRPLQPFSSSVAEEPNWPGLGAAVKQALLQAGLVHEAAELDEQLFVAKMKNLLVQVEQAVEGARLRSALVHLETMLNILETATRRSLVLGLLSDVLEFLAKQVEQELVIEKLETGLRSRIAERLQQSSMVGEAIRPVSTKYAEASIERKKEESLENQFFGRSVRTL